MANTSTLGAKLSGANENCWLRMGTHAARCNCSISRTHHVSNSLFKMARLRNFNFAIRPPPQNLAQSGLPRCSPLQRSNVPLHEEGTLLVRSFLDLGGLMLLFLLVITISFTRPMASKRFLWRFLPVPTMTVTPKLTPCVATHTTGQLGELMNDMDKALYCYENTLRHNPYSVKALMQIASICRTREQYPKVPLHPAALAPPSSSPRQRSLLPIMDLGLLQIRS
jgi:hypothetical protein